MKDIKGDAQMALNLVVERTLLNDEVNRLTGEIVGNTKQCHGVKGGRKRIIETHARHEAAYTAWDDGGFEGEFNEPPDVEPEIWGAWHAEATHLTHAFRRIGTKEHMGDRETKTHLSSEEVIAEVFVCPHCTAAYKGVLARKEARKALARVKRQMTALARKQLKL